MFRISNATPTVKLGWKAINSVTPVSTVYFGQIVKSGDGISGTFYDGISPLDLAVGIGDVTNSQHITGVAISSNNYPGGELYDPTYQGTYMTGATTQAAQKAIFKLGVEGMHPKTDPGPKMQVAYVNDDTLLIGDIRIGNFLGVLPELTVTIGDVNGLTFTANTCGFSPLKCQSTTYCRSGANAGMYRVNTDTSLTVATFSQAFPFPISVGDVFVRVPYVEGRSAAQSGADIDGYYFDAAAVVTTNYFNIFVTEMNLQNIGAETVTFHFVGI